MEVIIKFVLDMAIQNPQIAAILLIIGGFRVFMKPLISMAQAYVSSTKSEEDDKALNSFLSGPIFKAIEFIFDYLFSIKKIK